MPVPISKKFVVPILLDVKSIQLRAFFWVVIFALVFAGVTGTKSIAQTGASKTVDLSVFVPAPRELARPLARGRTAIAEQNWKDAVEYLGAVLNHPTSEDYLIEDEENPGTATSLRYEAQKLLGQVPKAERKNYEVRYGIQAQQLLNESVEKADYAEIADITRRYFHTPAGYLATMLLGHHHLDEGRPIAAAACFERVVDDPAARAEHDPTASILLSISYLLGKDPARAENVLQALKDRQPGSTIRFNGKDVQLFDNKALALDWLTTLVGDSPLIDRSLVDQWVMYRGDAQRNATSGTGFPLPYPQWELPTLNEPDQEALAKAAMEDFLMEHRATVPSIQPLAVNDTVIMRSATHLIGVNIQTGKRTWVFPPWDHNFFVPEDEFDDWKNNDRFEMKHITQRMWKDQIYGHASSDGKYVFVIDRPGFAEPKLNSRIIRGAGVDDAMGSRQFNELKAAELERQGAFKWEIGGVDGIDEPALAGAFFLGAPLPLHGTLYVLCELQGEIRLVALEAESGKLQWSQQIASIEATGTITENMYRRLGGASPSYANGLLVCPTSAGAIVAIDLSTQSLAWGFQYPIDRMTSSNRIRTQLLEVDNRPIDEKSLDATVTIADGYVVFQPVETDRIYCLDLFSGNAVWTQEQTEKHGIPREDALFVACIEEGSAVLVGKSDVRAIGLKNGKQVWKKDTISFGQPSGRGFVNRAHYIFPTTKSLLLKVDLKTGEIVDTARSTRVLGNLICYGNRVISHGVDYVASFAQDEPSIALIKHAEETGNIDEHILKLKAQIAYQRDNLTDAADAIEKAYLLNPNISNQRFLFDVILKLVELDFDIGSPIAIRYESLLKSKRSFDYLAAKVDGLIRKGDSKLALEQLMELANQEMLLGRTRADLENRYRKSADGITSLRVDRWFRSRLQILTSVANESELATQVEGLILKSINTKSPEQVYYLLKLCGTKNIKPSISLELARFLVDQNQFIQAEFILAELFDHPSLDVKATAEGLYGKLLAKSKMIRQANDQYRYLQQKFSDTICLDGKTGAELAADWFDSSNSAWSDRVWRNGHMHQIPNDELVKANQNYQSPTGMDCMQRENRAVEGLTVTFDTQNYQLMIANLQGQTIGKFKMRPTANQTRVYINSRIRGTYYIYGNLLVAQMGYDVVGINLFDLEEGNGFLWHLSLAHRSDDENPSNGLIVSNLRASPRSDKWGGTVQIIQSQQGQRVGVMSQISPNGICMIRGEQLICVDPLTGELLWRRADVKPDSNLASDETTVALMSSDEIQRVELFSLQDGKKLESPQIRTSSGSFWTRNRTDVLVTDVESKTQTMKLIDIKTGDELWSRTYPKGTQATIIENSEIAVCDPDGKFEVVNLADGTVTLTTHINAPSDSQRLIVERRRRNFLVFVTRQTPPMKQISEQKLQVRAVNYDEGLIDGVVYCIDRKSGQHVWDTPITIDFFNYIGAQPYDVPVIVLARVVYSTGTPRPYRSQVAVIDERNGKLVVWEHFETYMRTCSVSGNPQSQEATIDCGFGHLFTVTIGSDPVPPGPIVQLNQRFSFAPIIAEVTADQKQAELEKQRRKEALEKLEKIKREAEQQQQGPDKQNPADKNGDDDGN